MQTVLSTEGAGFLLGTSFLTFVFLGTLYMQQVLGFSRSCDRGGLDDGVGHLILCSAIRTAISL